MNMIGSAIVNKYTSVAHYGYGTSAISSLQNTGGSWVAIEDFTPLINYHTSAGDLQVTMADLFKDGVPKSPFGAGWEIRITADSTGVAQWLGDPPTLNIQQHPAFAIRDGSQTQVTARYTM